MEVMDRGTIQCVGMHDFVYSLAVRCAQVKLKCFFHGKKSTFPSSFQIIDPANLQKTEIDAYHL